MSRCSHVSHIIRRGRARVADEGRGHANLAEKPPPMFCSLVGTPAFSSPIFFRLLAARRLLLAARGRYLRSGRPRPHSLVRSASTQSAMSLGSSSSAQRVGPLRLGARTGLPLVPCPKCGEEILELTSGPGSKVPGAIFFKCRLHERDASADLFNCSLPVQQR